MNVAVIGTGHVGLVTGTCPEKMQELGFTYYSIGRKPVIARFAQVH